MARHRLLPGIWGVALLLTADAVGLAQAQVLPPAQPIPTTPSAGSVVPAVPGPQAPAGPIVPAQQPTPTPDIPLPPTTTPTDTGTQAPTTATPLGDIAARANAANQTSGTPSVGAAAAGTTDTAPRAPVIPASGAGATSVTGGGGGAGAALNAPDVSELLQKSPASVGVQTQRRNAIVNDPRIRGLRSGQYLTYGDGGLFIPGRPDLDTAVSKYDSGSIRDVIVVKGPYSVLYGPAFSVLDVATLDAPRYDGFQAHGRTGFGYQTNGSQWSGLQSVSVGDKDWGFRGTYNYLQGNDYRAGNGQLVPASYRSNNFNYALGLNLTEKSRIEFKGLRVQQTGVEFPGLYFDINQLDTEAYSVRYTAVDQILFDRLTFDVWYNATAANGNTQGGAKQAFVQQLLAQSFNQLPGVVPVSSLIGNPGIALFRDLSDTNFASRSIGYRLATSWGKGPDPLLTVGTDLRALGQNLTENIRLQQLQGPNVNTGVPVTAGDLPIFTQTQSIPQSNQIDPGIFFQSALPVTDRWKLRAGGRADWVNATSNPRLITGNINLFGPPPAPGSTVNPFTLDPIAYSSNPSNPALTRNYFLLAGFVQSEYKLDENWTALASVGHAQRPPTLTELYASGPFVGVLQQGTSRLIGDPNLSPEKMTQMDLGVVADYKVFQFGANAFYSWIHDYITYDANKSGLGLTQVAYTNTDLATLAGAEMFTQAELTRWLTSFGTLSYVQGIDQTASDHRRAPGLSSSRRDDPLTLNREPATMPLPQIPPLQSLLGFRIHAPTAAPRWQIEFSTQVVTGQNNVATNLGELPTPGYTIFNIRGYWRMTDNLLLSTGVENIGNKTYRAHLDPISGNLLNTGALFRPGTNYFFNMQYTY
jgi:outer membrane receptor protein involved in Fe transport